MCYSSFEGVGDKVTILEIDELRDQTIKRNSQEMRLTREEFKDFVKVN
jgi:hypothetical protein